MVPQVQRQRVKFNLQRNIGDKYVVDVENNQIDVLITGTNKKIRINVKPPVGGSYSAAKKTAVLSLVQQFMLNMLLITLGLLLIVS